MKSLFYIFLISIAACATPSPWVPAGGSYKADAQSFSVELPQEWMRFDRGEGLIITKDGILLQNISIARALLDQELKYTKKKFRKGMIPQEVAGVVLDNLQSNPATLNMEIIENVPATIGGHPGFKAIFTFKSKDGLRSKSILYGFLFKDWYYSIRYTAASKHYFDKDLNTFEKVFESFKLL